MRPEVVYAGHSLSPAPSTIYCPHLTATMEPKHPPTTMAPEHPPTTMAPKHPPTTMAPKHHTTKFKSIIQKSNSQLVALCLAAPKHNLMTQQLVFGTDCSNSIHQPSSSVVST